MKAASVLGLLILVSVVGACFAIYEEQVGLADWHKRYIGKVKHAVFHTQKTGRRRVVVSTEQNLIASLDLRTGDIFWRQVFGKNDVIDQLSLSLGKYVLTLSSQGSILRAWNLPDGQMVWETNLQVSNSNPNQSFLHVLGIGKAGRDNMILACTGGSIHAVSSLDGSIMWKKDLSNELNIKHIFQPSESDTIYAIGFINSSQIILYHINLKTGELIKQTSESSPVILSSETTVLSSDSILALDSAKSTLILIKFTENAITCYDTQISDFVEDFDGLTELVPANSNGVFVIKTASKVAFVRVKGDNGFELIEKVDKTGILSPTLTLSETEQAFAVSHNSKSEINLKVKLTSNNDLSETIDENVEIEAHRGSVQKIFLNNYIRTDKSHGFRALIVMQDESLLLVQQGKVVWYREDGLASITGTVTAELPVERETVSVKKVENTLFEWLKEHMIKLKGTLMLATPDDLAAIQSMRLKSSERNKMARDHNGFRKLIIALTRPGKLYALHTGDGRVVWSHLLCSAQCSVLSNLALHSWQVPHHTAFNQNPSVLVVGVCGPGPGGVFRVVDCYSGKEVESLVMDHGVDETVALPLTDASEQRLHLFVDGDLNAHLYPKSEDSLRIFWGEMANLYYYRVESEKGVIKGYSFKKGCGARSVGENCFGTREIWSIVFPSETEKIIATSTRKLNEVVHTQAKVTEQEVMYKYVSRNILFVATVSPKAAGEIGSASPDDATLTSYLIDAVTGRILHRVAHHGAQGPVHSVVSENWVVYHYFNLRAHRYEMSVIEIFDQSRADNKDVMKLILGKHNLTAPITSYTRPEIVAKSQSYFFAHSVKEITVTATAKGITSKQLLIGTVSDQVLGLDKRFLDPRRSANPTQAEREEGLIPLTDSLPIIPQSYITHSLQVEGLRGIISFPAKLESTTHVFSFGLDLFYTRIAPSRNYDSLTDDFSYALLLITIVALIGAIGVTWVLSERKELREKWR
ncbi:hypothetical protein LUZ60_010002 [Juncus effusus]|nr:hypothetical protein LUZ60_010002 [Juncus effusus]